MTTVVNLTHDKYDVFIGRPSIFGNPFKITLAVDRDTVINKYREYFYNRIERDEAFKNRVILECTGRRLGCYCHPQACHGDIIAEWLNSR